MGSASLRGTSPESLVAACSYLHGRGYALSTSGNVSIRCGDRICMTTTGIPLSDVRSDNLAWVDLEGNPLNKVPPTKEVALHLAVYARRPDVGAVIHVHTTHAIAASALLRSGDESYLPAVTPPFVVYAGRVPVLPYYPPGSAELAAAVGGRCTDSAVLLQNHGMVVFAENLRDAVHVVEEVEENCRLWLMIRDGGRLLSAAEVDGLLATHRRRPRGAHSP